jgi:hypothetical protein
MTITRTPVVRGPVRQVRYTRGAIPLPARLAHLPDHIAPRWFTVRFHESHLFALSNSIQAIALSFGARILRAEHLLPALRAGPADQQLAHRRREVRENVLYELGSIQEAIIVRALDFQGVEPPAPHAFHIKHDRRGFRVRACGGWRDHPRVITLVLRQLARTD